MRNLALLLAFHLSLCATQPVWQPLGQWLGAGCSGASACGPATDAASMGGGQEQSCPADKKGSARGCCAPFQCCFACCCFCNEQEQLPRFSPFTEKTRPSEAADRLLSQCNDEHFQPPELSKPA